MVGNFEVCPLGKAIYLLLQCRPFLAKEATKKRLMSKLLKKKIIECNAWQTYVFLDVWHVGEKLNGVKYVELIKMRSSRKVYPSERDSRSKLCSTVSTHIFSGFIHGRKGHGKRFLLHMYIVLL